eukprot:2808627-Rhodomonas_salina.1
MQSDFSRIDCRRSLLFARHSNQPRSPLKQGFPTTHGTSGIGTLSSLFPSFETDVLASILSAAEGDVDAATAMLLVDSIFPLFTFGSQADKFAFPQDMAAPAQSHDTPGEQAASQRPSDRGDGRPQPSPGGSGRGQGGKAERGSGGRAAGKSAGKFNGFDTMPHDLFVRLLSYFRT